MKKQLDNLEQSIIKVMDLVNRETRLLYPASDTIEYLQMGPLEFDAGSFVWISE